MAKTRQSSSTQRAGGKGNALTPLNWGVGIVKVALMSGLILGPELWVKVVCAALVFVVLIFYGYVYCYFMKKDPNRLQTEHFNLVSREMTLLHEPHATQPTITVEDTPDMVVDAVSEPVTHAALPAKSDTSQAPAG